MVLRWDIGLLLLLVLGVELLTSTKRWDFYAIPVRISASSAETNGSGEVEEKSLAKFSGDGSDGHRVFGWWLDVAEGYCVGGRELECCM